MNINDKNDDCNNFYIMDNGLIVFDEKALILNMACIVKAAYQTSIIMNEPITDNSAVGSAIVMVEALKERFKERNGKKSKSD